MIPAVSTTIRVRYAETDKMGVVYNANYLVWFEVGRTELFRELGLPYTLFEEQGLGLAVVEAYCRYRRGAKYDDEVTINTHVDQISSRRVTFNYQVMRNQEVLATGKTVHIFVNEAGKATDAKQYPIWRQLQSLLDAQRRIPE